ncbi:alpha-2,8-sialyltransferase 8B-like isoform X2 [Antedon mediterranea]|uniref:alpha-2,8-sialyltransferase 8B-like isoform X2 n=1 Tax=Antedon mediterranea TaxID=105859 RepID=UPI003AF93472
MYYILQSKLFLQHFYTHSEKDDSGTGRRTVAFNVTRLVVGVNNSNFSRHTELSLSEKFTRHINQQALVKFKQKIVKYKRFDAKLGILLYDGNLHSDMFKNWYNRKTRPKESPPLGTYDTCAIVGNSGVLKHSHCGKEIDEHDFVIRNNMAPTEGFENDVGTKTSLMSINSALVSQINMCLENATCLPTYLKKFKSLTKNTILWFSKVFSPSSRQKKYYTLSEFVKNVSLPLRIGFPTGKMSTTEFWKIKRASSGLMMFSVAATFCRNITLYGFYPYSTSPSGRQLTYHYYDNFSFKNSHDMNSEHKTLTDLNKTGVIRVITDDCN